MILGYVDVEDRIYDLNFATLRLRVRVEAAGPKEGSRVTFSQVAGAGSASYRILEEADASAEVSMDHDGKRVPLLRPVEGHLIRHEAGLLFFATPAKRDPDDPGFDSVRYWRGPVWAVINFLVGSGLSCAGHESWGERIRGDTRTLIAEGGMYEYFCPVTGRGVGGDDFSWTAAMWLHWARGDRPMP